jgi:predicted membrane metal-binding protein
LRTNVVFLNVDAQTCLMNWIIIILIVLIVMVAFAVLYKLATFVIKVASLVLLLALLIWGGFYLYQQNAQSDTLYIIKQNDTYAAYDLTGKSLNITDIDSTDYNSTTKDYAKIYLIDKDQLGDLCTENMTKFACIKASKNISLWKLIRNESISTE